MNKHDGGKRAIAWRFPEESFTTMAVSGNGRDQLKWGNILSDNGPRGRFAGSACLDLREASRCYQKGRDERAQCSNDVPSINAPERILAVNQFRLTAALGRFET